MSERMIEYDAEFRKALELALMIPNDLFTEQLRSASTYAEQHNTAFRNQLIKLAAAQVTELGWILYFEIEKDRARLLYQRWHDDGIALAELSKRLEQHYARWCK